MHDFFSDPTLNMLGFVLAGIISFTGEILVTSDDQSDAPIYMVILGMFSQIHPPWDLPWGRTWTWGISISCALLPALIGFLLRRHTEKKSPP